MSGFYTRQPGKAIYTILFFLRISLRLPWFLFLFLFPSQRPDRHWSYRQALGRTVVHYVSQYVATIELKPPFSLKAGKEKGRFVLVAPLGDRFYRDILNCDPEIKPTTIGAVWYPEPLTQASPHHPGRRIFFHLHGGAYILGGGRNADVGFATSLLVKNSPGSKVFCPEYRLASFSGGRFPAALQDAVTAYAHLVGDLGVPSSDVVLSGDSAGANLALALLRYINEHQDILPVPAAILLWSPWTDMTGEVADAAKRPAAKVDHVGPELITWAYREFLPGENTKVSRDNPYISANKGAPLATIPMWVQWGSNEVLVEEDEEFVRIQASGNEGDDERRLRTYVIPYAPHDVFTLAPVLGWEKEAAVAVEDAVRFLDGTKS
ncbi:Alpha/Beta hydrolase protein [Hypomontagnella submonticulosa]|nr:Alpha/Beta hydrolase protein [Hypomontagnella submonticulosa]